MIMLHIASHYEALPQLCNRPQPPAKLHFPCSRFGHEISWTWHSLAFSFAFFCASAIWVVKWNRNLLQAVLAAFLCSQQIDNTKCDGRGIGAWSGVEFRGSGSDFLIENHWLLWNMRCFLTLHTRSEAGWFNNPPPTHDHAQVVLVAELKFLSERFELSSQIQGRKIIWPNQSTSSLKTSKII